MLVLLRLASMKLLRYGVGQSNMGIMGKKLETIIMGYIGFRV